MDNTKYTGMCDISLQNNKVKGRHPIQDAGRRCKTTFRKMRKSVRRSNSPLA